MSTVRYTNIHKKLQQLRSGRELTIQGQKVYLLLVSLLALYAPFHVKEWV